MFPHIQDVVSTAQSEAKEGKGDGEYGRKREGEACLKGNLGERKKREKKGKVGEKVEKKRNRVGEG